MYRTNGGPVLEPTTRDEVAQYGETVGYVELTPDGMMLLALPEPLEVKHKEEETVRIPAGLYRLRGDSPWGGALTGVVNEKVAA